MDFEQYQMPVMLGPMAVQQALSDIPLFGEHKADIDGLIQRSLQPHYAMPRDYTDDAMISNRRLPESFSKGASTAQKLQDLRDLTRENLKTARTESDLRQSQGNVQELTQSLDDLSISHTEPPSNRQLHESLLSQNIDARGLPKEAQIVLDHISLLRAHNRYLFDSTVNRNLLSDDPWLRDMWDWIGGTFSFMG